MTSRAGRAGAAAPRTCRSYLGGGGVTGGSLGAQQGPALPRPPQRGSSQRCRSDLGGTGGDTRKGGRGHIQALGVCPGLGGSPGGTPGDPKAGEAPGRAGVTWCPWEPGCHQGDTQAVHRTGGSPEGHWGSPGCGVSLWGHQELGRPWQAGGHPMWHWGVPRRWGVSLQLPQHWGVPGWGESLGRQVGCHPRSTGAPPGDGVSPRTG